MQENMKFNGKAKSYAELFDMLRNSLAFMDTFAASLGGEAIRQFVLSQPDKRSTLGEVAENFKVESTILLKLVELTDLTVSFRVDNAEDPNPENRKIVATKDSPIYWEESDAEIHS